jgi:membrane-bound lytic murein transglycosylase D
MAVHPLRLAGSLAAVLALTGCPSDPAVSARPPAQATAPTQQAQPAPAPATTPPTAPAPPAAPQAALPPAPPPNTQQQEAQAQRDRTLIDSVDKAYHTGLSDYQQGHLASARANFDYAVDLMLKCQCDIRSDQTISDEFDRIVDAVNTLELDALRQGNGLSPQAEPSPVDVAGNITTPANPTVTARATAELKTTQSDLPLIMNEYVAAYIDFFTNSPRGHATIVASLERMGRYRNMIEGVLKQEGVPQDLIYQAVAESGFRPQAVNPRSGAAGMWQFMPWGTYGLERTAWFDQRFDPIEATRAYAREIKKNYDQLGDWYLAMAAYDWGAGNIQRAVQRTGYADFWELYKRNNLPQETKNYVPIILAVTIMAKNPKQYGLADLTPDPPLVTDTVTTDYSVDLRLVSDIVGAPVQEIAALNPSLLRMSTPPDDSFDLHLPAGTRDVYEREIAEIPVDKRRYWRLQSVAQGDTLETVAHKWHVSESELAFVNQISETSDLAGVDSLVIPLAPASEPRSLRNAVYHPRRGDTLVTIADRFGVTVGDLRRWNHLRGEAVVPGSSLYVAEPAHISAAERTRHRATGKPAAKPKTSANRATSKKKPS